MRLPAQVINKVVIFNGDWKLSKLTEVTRAAAMATGLLTLPRFPSDLTQQRPMLSPSRRSPIDESTSQSLSPSNVRSPWIRLFKLFQSKNRQELDRSKNSSSIKVGDNGASECDVRASPRKRDIKDEEAKVKRNIYRRPNSRAVFNQRLSPGVLTDGSRNPGRRKSDPINDPPNAQETSPVSPIPLEAYSYRRPRSCSMPAVCHGQGLQRRMEKVKLDDIRKQTTFQEDISIVYYEEDELNERLVQVDEIDDVIDEATSSDDAEPGTPEKSRSATNLDECTNVVRPGDCKSIDIPPHFSLGKTRRGLRIMMEIDELCVRRKTCVRAMSGGKTLVVLSYKPQSEGHLTEHKDVINLPVNIDPFSVKANMLKSGHLCIQAPLRKESI